jgi:YidC/Oxa1 family membrane protein insertase
LDTRRLLLAAVLSLAVMLAWGYFFPPPEIPERQPVPETQEEPRPQPMQPLATVPDEAATVEEAEEPPDSEVSAAQEPLYATNEERSVVEGGDFRAELSNRGAQLISFQLLDHQSGDGGPVDLVRERATPPYPFGLVDLVQGAPSALNDALFEVERGRSAIGEDEITYRYRGPLGEAEKRFVFRASGLIEVEITGPGEGTWAVTLGPGIRNPTAAEVKNRFARRSAIYRDPEGVSRVDPTAVREPQAVSGMGLRWVGLQDTYFLTAAIPLEGLGQVMLQQALVVPGAVDEPARFVPLLGEEELSDEQKELPRELLVNLMPLGERLKTLAYWGPKQYDRLASLGYGLEETVNLGWFRFLSRPLMLGLAWIHDNLVANYGWAIILMTILIRIVLFPLTHKSTVSMQKMQKLNPKVQAIRQKYRGKLKDKQGRPNAEMQRKMNEETMALYKQEGVNPAGGCLPMLLQIPVLFAFYSLLTAAIELRHAPWIFWIQDLSAKDPLYVLPVVMGASQFLQQKMTPAAGDPMQRRMFALMPIFFTVLFLGFPSGLVLYWLTNNVLGIAQQAFYRRHQEQKEEEKKGKSGGPAADKSRRGSRK